MRWGLFWPGGDFGWLLPLLLLLGLFFLRRCGWGGCGGPRFPGRFGGRHGSDKSVAMEILDTRYARGEIDAEEYRRKKAEILGQGPDSA